MMTGTPTHLGTLLAVLRNTGDAERFTEVRSFLREQLVMTRDTPIGRDYLFAGGSEELHAALKDLVAIEHKHPCNLKFDYTELNEYFLLRIVGQQEEREDIASYFD